MRESFQYLSWIQDIKAKSASKYCIGEIKIHVASLINFQIIQTQPFKHEIIHFCRHHASLKIVNF